MTPNVLGGILRVATRIARTSVSQMGPAATVWLLSIAIILPAGFAQVASTPERSVMPEPAIRSTPGSRQNRLAERDEGAGALSMQWDFGRSEDPEFLGRPDGWKRYEGVGYPRYVRIGIQAKDLEWERQLIRFDTALIQIWKQVKDTFPSIALPHSITDLVIDRYLRVDLDGGQAKYESPSVPTQRVFQYGFSCKVMTDGLHHDSARAELVFKNDLDEELAVHSTPRAVGTTAWESFSIGYFRPPVGATRMSVRVLVERGEDGVEDIQGSAGFDDLRVKRYPQLKISTDRTLGVYHLGERVEVQAKVMGLPRPELRVLFRLLDADDQEVYRVIETAEPKSHVSDKWSGANDGLESSIKCELPRLDSGFYRVDASIVGRDFEVLSNQTTFAIIDENLGGPPSGSFGWSFPNDQLLARYSEAESGSINERDFADWLADLGVAWVKYPCWLDPNDTAAAESTALLFGKLQDAGIQTVGVLDHPPQEQLANYSVNESWDMVAAQLFRNPSIWQPLLEPVMTRLTLKVRTWQLGAERDFSFLGRAQLGEFVHQTSLGLEGFGQPIDVAISWPWLEPELPAGEASWQAVCRSSDPPLSAKQLDAYLALREEEFGDQRPRTWLILDPIAKKNYDRQTRIRDLVLRMATVRSHQVQAAFVSDPRSPQTGLLRSDGRPEVLLLPWRTTSRLIGNAKPGGSLSLRSGAENTLFVAQDQVVLMVWSAEPTEEQIYLGKQIRMVDIWGKVTPLANEVVGNQEIQRIPIGPIPKFLLGVDPELIAFRMSVKLKPNQLDSYLGEQQQLEVAFANPTDASLSGSFTVQPPKSWSIDDKRRPWEMLAGRETSQAINVVLSNTSKIGQYELPLQFTVQSDPPQVITVYKKITVGPEGLDLEVDTKMMPNGDLRVQIEMTNRMADSQAYDCMLFPSAERQYQRKFLQIEPGQTARTEVRWTRGENLVGTRMLLRANAVDRRRVLNHAFEVTR